MSNTTQEIIDQVCTYGKVDVSEIVNDVDIFEAGYLDSIESLEFSIFLCNKYPNLKHEDLVNLKKISVNSISGLIKNL